MASTVTRAPGFHLEFFIFAIVKSNDGSYNISYSKIEPQDQTNMFKKIIDKPPCSIQLEFLQSFGIDCLSKIKNIELKFNQVEWENEKYSFQFITLKVKTMLECYQIIAHQIYDSFESVQLESLGHSIVKMFLQIASAIKWLIKSFTFSYQKSQKSQEKPGELKFYENQTEKFRKREISRFILKGVMKKRDSETREENENNVDSIESIFSQNKESIKNSRNKILSVNSSNLPILLEDTLDYLTKKSEYIQKFIALRENYEGLNRLEQTLTSQAIMESEYEARKNESSSRLKDIFHKIITLQDSKKPKTCENGIQVSISPLISDKFKKAAEKSKIKILYDQIEVQRNINKELKLRLELCESRLESKSIKENELEIVNKKLNFGSMSKKSSRFEQSSQKSTIEYKKLKEEAIEDLVPELIDSKKMDNEVEYFKNFRTLKKASSRVTSRPHSVRQFEPNTSIVKVQQNIAQVRECLKLVSNVHTLILSAAKHPKLSQASVVNIQIIAKPEIASKKYQGNLLKPGEAQQFEEAQKKIIYGKASPATLEHTAAYLSPAMSLGEQNFCKDSKTQANKQNIGSLQDNRSFNRRHNKIQTHVRSMQRNSSIKSIFVSNTMSKSPHAQLQQQQLRSKLEKLYFDSSIQNHEINPSVLCHFFIDQQIAKNYEILNLSEICQLYKRTSNEKRSTEIKSENSSFSVFNKPMSSQGREIQISIQGQFAKRIFSQLCRMKKTKKSIYWRIVLFLRYPHSSCYRKAQIQKKFDENQQKPFYLPELQQQLRRIQAIHNRCSVVQNRSTSPVWCKHKQYMLEFFGIREVREKNEIGEQKIQQ